MSGQGKRAVGVIVGTLAVCAAIGLYVGLYLVNVPGSAAATQTAAGVAALPGDRPGGRARTIPHPTWVSYYAVNANDQNWRHVTTYVLPANTLVHVTIFQYDSQTGLRNPFLSQATGTVGRDVPPRRQADQERSHPTAASHVFAIPQIGLSVPLLGRLEQRQEPVRATPRAR